MNLKLPLPLFFPLGQLMVLLKDSRIEGRSIVIHFILLAQHVDRFRA